jgi:polysaccharide deacetylase family protein (PEP-CTERM system associated)
MQHIRVWTQSPNEFFQDASDARKLLEDISGEQVIGYRAASWSIDSRTPWAHDVLAEAGYKYSSSIYPIDHDHFGMPEALTHPYPVAKGALLEIPASTARIFGRNIPAAGGGYFRLYPIVLSKYLIRRQQLEAAHPYVFYFHPWELDPDQPRMANAAAKSRFRHYLNLHKFENRLEQILQQFSWGRMDDIFLGATL